MKRTNWTRADKDDGGDDGIGPLFDGSMIPEPERPKLEREFVEFHEANPNILDEAIRFARAFRDTGKSEGSIDLVWEELRRVHPVETASDDGFRLNNNFRAYYARLAMHRAPDLAGFFEVRRQKDPFDPATVRG